MELEERCSIGSAHREPALARAVEELLLLTRPQFGERPIGRDLEVAAKGVEHGSRKRRGLVGPKLDRSIAERKMVAHQMFECGSFGRTESFAMSTPAARMVEGEVKGRQGLELAAARFAGQLAAERPNAPMGFGATCIRLDHLHQAFPGGERRFDAVGNATSMAPVNDDSVDDDGCVGRVECLGTKLVEGPGSAFCAEAHKTLFAHRSDGVVEIFGQVERRRDEESRLGWILKDKIDNLVDGACIDRYVARGAVRLPESSHQDAQIVVDLRDRADGRPGRVSRVPLLDGDRRRESLDMFQTRFGHLADELPGVGTEALDVAALSLGIDRVHGEGCLA